MRLIWAKPYAGKSMLHSTMAWQNVSWGSPHQTPVNYFCHCPQQRQNFPRSAQREEKHTLDSITASGSAWLLRTMLSPFCTGKIICKYNAYTRSSQLLGTWFSITQIPPTWRIVLPSLGQSISYSYSLADIPSNTNMSGICICSHSSSKLMASKNARKKMQFCHSVF